MKIRKNKYFKKNSWFFLKPLQLLLKDFFTLLNT